MTHWALADGTGVEIINYIDDHSRLCVASVVVPVATAINTAETFLAACNQWETPASLLTDNGCIYTAKHRNGRVMLETLTETQGVTYKHCEREPLAGQRLAAIQGDDPRHLDQCAEPETGMSDIRTTCVRGSSVMTSAGNGGPFSSAMDSSRLACSSATRIASA